MQAFNFTCESLKILGEAKMLIIGESINGTIPKVVCAIREKNEAFLRELAKTQYELGHKCWM